MSDDKFLTNEGDSIAEVSVEKRESEVSPVVVEEVAPVVVSPRIREFNCLTCRKLIPEDKAMKLPLDYVREEDGSLGKSDTRFSLFCPVCQFFLAIASKQ